MRMENVMLEPPTRLYPLFRNIIISGDCSGNGYKAVVIITTDEQQQTLISSVIVTEARKSQRKKRSYYNTAITCTHTTRYYLACLFKYAW